MYHYLFTNDLRISKLNESLQSAGKLILEDRIPSASEDKSLNNNVNTLGFYFNLNNKGECAKAARDGRIREVVLNFIKKFQFPNYRTEASYQEAIKDEITLAPMRIIVKILHTMNILINNSDSYLSKDEIKNFIFYNKAVAKNRNPNIVLLIQQIIDCRNTNIFPESIDRNEENHFWNQEPRQLNEMLKVLTWSGCIKEKNGLYKIDNSTISMREKSNIYDIINCNDYWAGGSLESYQQYMEMNEGEEQDIIEEMDTIEKTNNELIFKTEISNMGFERNRIIFGAPGTGKSYKLKHDSLKLLKGCPNSFERVTFHPEYTYSQFVGTYKPVMDNDGKSIIYKFVPGPFIRVYIDAMKDVLSGSSQPHLLIIEEINRAKVASVFGDIFQLLDRDPDGVSEYEIQTTEDIRRYLSETLGGNANAYKKIRIPNNMFIWATMNSADQGVYPMDTAFKRRWDFEYLGIDSAENELKGKAKFEIKGKIYEWNNVRKAINAKMLSDEYRINEDKLLGPFFIGQKFIESNTDTGMILDQKKFLDVFKNKVLMYLYEDAVRHSKQKFFAGCDSSKYSSVCNAFDEVGVNIFGDDFCSKYLKHSDD